MSTPDNDMEEFVDFILSKDENELGLEHPSVEEEERERAEADKIMKAKEDAELEKIADSQPKPTYNTCSRFYGVEKGVCKNIHQLGPWIKDINGLNMHRLIDTLLKDEINCEDLNHEYQDALEILHKTGKFNDIKVINGKYHTEKLTSCSLVKDEKGDWHYVNKLNTNWSDLSELLTTLFIKGGKIEELSQKNVTELKNYLIELRQNNLKDIKKSNLYRLFKKYFDIEEYKDFTLNTQKNTAIGDEIEDLAIELLESKGFKLIYHGRNGNFIDMKYGIDMIMELDGEVFLIQVKSKAAAAKKAMDYPTYKHIDIFVGESPDKNGVILYDRDQLTEGTFIEKELLKENMDYLINKFYNTGEVNLGE